MNENVSIGKTGLTVVSIGDTDYSNRICEWFRGDSLIPSVQLPRKEDARLGQELFPRCGWLWIEEVT